LSKCQQDIEVLNRSVGGRVFLSGEEEEEDVLQELTSLISHFIKTIIENSLNKCYPL
jgi:hypothetical protein